MTTKDEKLIKEGKEACEKEGEEEAADIGGDVLESILCHVPLVDLVPTSLVSKSWNRAVFSSLGHFSKPKPWLIIYAQRLRPPYTTTALAYDPRSNLWLRIIPKPPVDYVSALRSSNSTFLYMLSLSKFSFSFDPLHLTWHHVDPPIVWRTDPVVAMVGRYVILAGGSCDFEDDPLSVEIYDINTRRWDTCESMPAILKDYASSTWLSVAADQKKFYVVKQVSGIMYSFDPIPSSRIWYGPFDLRQDQNIYFSVIGISRDKLIMVGLLGFSKNVKDIKVWEVKGESYEICEEIGMMPKELVEKLKGECKILNSIKMSFMGDLLYIYNPEELEELVACEINGEGRPCQWGSLKNAVVSDWSKVAERMVITCADVGLGDLGKAVGSKKAVFQY